MKWWKKVLAGIMMMEMMVTACGNNSDREAIAKAALENKYNETFEITEMSKNPDSKDVFDVQAYSVSNPEILIYARVGNDGSTVADNYLAKYMGGKIADRIDANLGGLLGPSLILVSPLIEDMGIGDLSMSIDEYAALNPKNTFTVSIYYTPEKHDADYIYECLANAFQSLEKLRGKMILHVIDEENLHHMQEYVESHGFYRQHEYEDYLADEMKIQTGYSNGAIDLSHEEFIGKVGDKV